MKLKVLLSALALTLLFVVSTGYAGTEEDALPFNTYFGYNAGVNNTGGMTNAMFGASAGYANNGSDNVFFGYGSGAINSGGSANVFIGTASGMNSTGSSNVFIGNLAGRYEAGSNLLYIENSDSSNPLIYGEFDNDLVIIYGSLEINGSAQSSDKRYKKDITPIKGALDKVMEIDGVSYEWRRDTFSEHGFPEGRHYGVIGQEMEKVLPDLVTESREGYKKVAYTEMIPVLLEAIKEQQETITSLSSKVDALEKELRLKGNVAMAGAPR